MNSFDQLEQDRNVIGVKHTWYNEKRTTILECAVTFSTKKITIRLGHCSIMDVINVDSGKFFKYTNVHTQTNSSVYWTGCWDLFEHFQFQFSKAFSVKKWMSTSELIGAHKTYIHTSTSDQEIEWVAACVELQTHHKGKCYTIVWIQIRSFGIEHWENIMNKWMCYV